MKQSMMTKNLLQSMRRSLGRYIAIAVIIALGAAMFVGLRSTRMDMVATGQVYADRQNMFDLRLISAYGWGMDQVADIAALDGVVDAEGIFYADVIANRGDGGEASVYRFYTIPDQVDRLVLLEGRMPESPDECLADGFRNGRSAIGRVLTVAGDNSEQTLEKLNERQFTIVGTVSTPLYMDMNRGNTSVGSGSIANYFFVPSDAFDVDYFTEIHVTIPGEYAIYSKAYNDAMSDAADALKPQVEAIGQARLDSVRADAQQALDDGRQEYADGLWEYAQEKEKALRKLEDAYRELEDAEHTLRQSQQKLEDGDRQITEGQETLLASKRTLAQSRQQLANTQSQSLLELAESSASAMVQLQDLSADKRETDSALLQNSLDLVEVNTYIFQFEYGLIDATEDEKAEAYDKRTELEAEQAKNQKHSQELDDLISKLEEMLAGIALQQIMMNQQFAAAEAQITAGEAQIKVAEDELVLRKEQLASGWEEFHEGMEAYHDGVAAFWDGKREADTQFAEAEQKLADAAAEIADAEETISGMTENNVYILDRNTNVGYSSLDSSSQIVAGVSRVFPVFFLLVAALVCITTMTRMVDEERTQIGTLKALGYSSAAIIGKYLIYAGSSAVLGCVIGVSAGSVIFPMALWEAYKIMIFITPQIALRFDWALALEVTVTYTAAMLLVTWYCCYKALQEVPAELIRPKAPTSGKQLLIEKLPFWNSLSFLNKVSVRNIFRYHQRLAMMLLGIGGCTALLMTGFGLRDTIEKIVDVQFEEVTVYDMEVYFRENQTEDQQKDFRKTMSAYADRILFFNQISAEISTDVQTRDIYLISASGDISKFMDFHSGKDSLELPGTNEVLLSAGICDILGIHTGDQITMRNPDMEVLELTVSGIYDNHVYNYAIISPKTVEQQWGRTPEQQMAFITVRQGVDPNAAGACASGAEGVMSVTVSEQMADMVSTMMKALDLVVIIVVFCAGLLAVIVLYNLTNINITERIREIATIKVLGFNAVETALYVFKENLVLSVMGTFFGLPLGKLLLDFVISQIKIDMIWLKARLELPSLAISVVLTVLSAILVDLIFYYKLDRINMAEALKSVE